MRGRKRGDFSCVHEIQNGDGKCRSFCGIRAAPELVEQTQTVLVCTLQDIHNRGHMRGERGQALLDALLVTDVRIHLAEQGQFTVLSGRNVESCHSHQLKETDCFQCDRFAAGVRAGDNDHVVILSDGQIDGNNLLRINEGMASLVNPDDVVLVKIGTDSVFIQSKTRLGKNKVQLRHVRAVVAKRSQMIRKKNGQGGQNLLLFLVLPDLQLADGISHLDNGSRLDKECRSGGGLIVYDAAHLGLVFTLDRQAVAVIADRNDIVLQIGRVGLIQHFPKLGVDPVIGQSDFAADSLQLGACIIGDAVLRKNTAADLRGYRT